MGSRGTSLGSVSRSRPKDRNRFVISTGQPPISLATAVGKEAGVLIVGLAETSEGDILIGLPEDLGKSFAKAIGSDVASLATQLGGSAKTGRTVLLAAPGGWRIGGPPVPAGDVP